MENNTPTTPETNAENVAIDETKNFVFSFKLNLLFSVLEKDTEATALLLHALRNYVFKGVELQPPSPVLAQFLLMKNEIDLEKNRVAEISQKRSEAGRLGAEATKAKRHKALLRKLQKQQAVEQQQAIEQQATVEQPTVDGSATQ